jgi:hypothetical protein
MRRTGLARQQGQGRRPRLAERPRLHYGGAYRLASNGMDFRILGPLEVLGEGRAVKLGGGKQRALLGMDDYAAAATALADEVGTGT